MRLDEFFQMDVVFVVAERIDRCFTKTQPRKINKKLNIQNSMLDKMMRWKRIIQIQGITWIAGKKGM